MAWAQTAPSRLHTGAAVVLRARGPQSHSQQHAASATATRHTRPLARVNTSFRRRALLTRTLLPNHVPAQADLHTQADELCLS